jgi:murein DD-endopeptidase MepM/ murein hydrolase activator NlpD
MRMFRFSLPSFSSIPTLKNPLKSATRSVIATAALTLAVAASVFFPGSSPSVDAKSSAYGIVAGPYTPFLTLPFQAGARMSVLSGWYYSGGGGFHGGIDFINGSVNNISGWETFPVIAAADGEACGNCTSRQGNAVWVKHNINGATYYTYYGHLASIAKGIPLGSQSSTVYVKRGQVVGMAGDTGARGILHLHFALYNANSTPMDPYGIGKLRQYYPQPGDSKPGRGWFLGN